MNLKYYRRKTSVLQGFFPVFTIFLFYPDYPRLTLCRAVQWIMSFEHIFSAIRAAAGTHLRTDAVLRRLIETYAQYSFSAAYNSENFRYPLKYQSKERILQLCRLVFILYFPIQVMPILTFLLKSARLSIMQSILV